MALRYHGGVRMASGLGRNCDRMVSRCRHQDLRALQGVNKAFGVDTYQK